MSVVVVVVNVEDVTSGAVAVVTVLTVLVSISVTGNVEGGLTDVVVIVL